MSDSKNPQINVDKISIRHYSVGSISNQHQFEGLCNLGGQTIYPNFSLLMLVASNCFLSYSLICNPCSAAIPLRTVPDAVFTRWLQASYGGHLPGYIASLWSYTSEDSA